MENYSIGGIQQLGIGVPDVQAIWKWYRQVFGTDIRMFEEAAEAPLMIPYTGGQVHSRTATLAVNLNGGGGFEIWQFTSRNTEKASFDILLGDTGIYAGRIKSRDISATYREFRDKKVTILGEICGNPAGVEHFFIQDPNGNIFDIVPATDWFSNTGSLTGNAAGAMIGVSDIEKALKLYSNVLGYDNVLYDKQGVFEDLKGLPGGAGQFRRVLLGRNKPMMGPFSNVFGESHIELVQALDRTPRKIFENRFWGDWGFIHLCFDIVGMDALKKQCEAHGFPFTVDSADSFNMGEAAGRFSYVEDPDGALIEFVETHKIPLIKKIGWYKNLKGRGAKPLPDWMLKTIRFNRVKD
jgi:catechol 2,3-dioxygenase-like lactoylglutathione lyase family enzyme